MRPDGVRCAMRERLDRLFKASIDSPVCKCSETDNHTVPAHALPIHSEKICPQMFPARTDLSCCRQVAGRQTFNRIGDSQVYEPGYFGIRAGGKTAFVERLEQELSARIADKCLTCSRRPVQARSEADEDHSGCCRSPRAYGCFLVVGITREDVGAEVGQPFTASAGGEGGHRVSLPQPD